MEITSISSKSIVISSKRGSVAIDIDENFSDYQAVILTKEDGEIQSEQTLLIEGPGEYETSGLYIKGTRQNSSTVYQIESPEGKVLFSPSGAIDKIQDSEYLDAIIIKVEGGVDDAKISSLSGLVILFGDEKSMPDKLKEVRLPKVNLKRKDKISGNVVLLSK